MTPIGPPINTIGMLSIKLQLNKSELVNTIQINLYRSKDSQAVGLSQIRLLGYPIFENMLSAKPDMMLTPVEDLVSRSNMGWLRLLYMCLTSCPTIEKFVCQSIQEKTMLLCTRLLSSPAIIIYDKIIETILIKLSKYNPKRNLEITKCLLRLENGLESAGLYSVPHGILIETLVNILFQINKITYDTDEFTNATDLEKSRADLILSWLKEQCFIGNKNMPSNMLLHCVACLIYCTNSLPTNLDLNELLQSLINYSMSLDEYYSKQSIEWVLCSLFKKQPKLIEILTNMLPLNELTKYMNSDFRNKTEYDVYSKERKQYISLIETLSISIQSPEVIELLVNSEFFAQLVKIFHSFIENTNAENQVFQLNFLKVFIAIAEFQYGQDWLCSAENGSLVWKKIIEFLCKTQANHVKLTLTEEISGLVIKLIKKMLFCNKANQTIFAIYLSDLIKRAVSLDSPRIETSQLSGFLNQLILQVFLEDQTLTVNFQRKSTIFKIACNSSLGLLTHPRYGTGSGCRCVEVSMFKTCTEMINSISDVSISQIISREKLMAKPSSVIEDKDIEMCIEMNGVLTNLKNLPESGIDKTKSQQQQPISLKSNDSKLKLLLRIDNREISLPNDMTLWNVLRLYLSQTKKRFVRDLTLIVQLNDGSTSEQSENFQTESMNAEDFELLNNYVISSPLDEFVKYDGLITLSERLPILMPFIQVSFKFIIFIN